MKQTAPTQSWSSSTPTVTAIKHMSGLTGPCLTSLRRTSTEDQARSTTAGELLALPSLGRPYDNAADARLRECKRRADRLSPMSGPYSANAG